MLIALLIAAGVALPPVVTGVRMVCPPSEKVCYLYGPEKQVSFEGRQMEIIRASARSKVWEYIPGLDGSYKKHGRPGERSMGYWRERGTNPLGKARK